MRGFAASAFKQTMMLTPSVAATATAATEKRGDVGPGPMHGEAQRGVYDVEMNGVRRKG